MYAPRKVLSYLLHFGQRAIFEKAKGNHCVKFSVNLGGKLLLEAKIGGNGNRTFQSASEITRGEIKISFFELAVDW